MQTFSALVQLTRLLESSSKDASPESPPTHTRKPCMLEPLSKQNQKSTQGNPVYGPKNFMKWPQGGRKGSGEVPPAPSQSWSGCAGFQSRPTPPWTLCITFTVRHFIGLVLGWRVDHPSWWWRRVKVELDSSSHQSAAHSQSSPSQLQLPWKSRSKCVGEPV